MDLDKLQELLDSGIAMIKACSKPPLTLDDEAPADTLNIYREPDLFTFSDDELNLPSTKTDIAASKLKPSGCRSSLVKPHVNIASTAKKPDAVLASVAGIAVSSTPIRGTMRPLANSPRPTGHIKAGAGFCTEITRPTYSRRANRSVNAVCMTRLPTSTSTLTKTAVKTPLPSCQFVSSRPVGIRMIRLPAPPITSPLTIPNGGTQATELVNPSSLKQEEGKKSQPTASPSLLSGTVPRQLVVPLPQLLAAGLLSLIHI